MGGMNATLRYTQLGFVIASLLDRENPLDPELVREYIKDGSLFTWLSLRYDGAIDLSLYETADQTDVLERFGSILETTDSRRKFGVERDGLALLAACCFEVLQQMHYLGQ
jgi:hypothetical protein